MRHRNLTKCTQSLVFIDTFNQNDTIMQMSRCSFDIHVQEILSTLIIGATLVMLHPRGNIDFDYLHTVLKQKQISYMHSVPTLLHSFFSFLNETNHGPMKYLRALCSSGKKDNYYYYRLYTISMFFLFLGEACSAKLVGLLIRHVSDKCHIWNLYGPAETTIDCTFHLVNIDRDTESIPTGVPLPNYQCLILDEFQQSLSIGQEGELFVGGVRCLCWLSWS